MRKVLMILTLAVSYLAMTGAASANMPGGSPQCGDDCGSPIGN
ncbi:MAG: hypothetical protein ABJC09_15260 [Terriglobia bacterium]